MIITNIYNWEENCLKILSDKQYTTKRRQVKEQIVLINYLQQQQTTKEDIYKIWNNIPNSFAEYETMYRQQALFEQLWNKALLDKTLEQESKHQIVIHNSEIEYINSLECEGWFRQYLLGLLFFYKFYGGKGFNKKRPHIDILKLIGIKSLTYRQERLMAEYNKKYKLYKSSVRTYLYNTRVELEVLFPKYIEVKQNDLCTTKNPLNFVQLFWLLKDGVSSCKNCGKAFEINARTKREICEECYSIERKKYQTENKRKERQKRCRQE